MLTQKHILLFMLVCWFKVGAFAQDKLADSLIQWTYAHPNIDSQYILTLHRISYRLCEKDIKKSFSYYEKVMALSDSLDFTYGKSLAQINLGLLLYNSANFDASNKAFFKAIDYAEACGAYRLKAVALNNIGDNLKTLQDIDKCRQYVNEAIGINTKLQMWRGVAINFELLHQCDLIEKLYPQSKNKLVKGMPFALKANESYILSQFYLGFGKLQAIQGNNDSANYYFYQAMNQADILNDLRNKFQVYLAQAAYLKNISQTKKIILLDSALQIAKQTNYLKGVSDAAQELSTVYDQRNQEDSSLYYYRVFRGAADSLFSENNKRNVIIRESEWMIKRKEIENAHLKQLAQLQSKELVVKNSLLMVVAVSLFFALIIVFFIYKNDEAKKKRTESLLKQKITEVQMQVLRAQMNPHFIFNSLNSIENFMMQNQKRQASDYLNKFTRLIRTILDSSFNELVPVAKDMEALQLYIDLQLLRFNNKFIYATNIEKQLLSGDYKVPSLIIQPFVENSIEHGFAHCESNHCTLMITAAIQNNYLVYVIEDNGVGRQQAETYNAQNRLHHKSVGLSITADRIHIFNGTDKNNEDVVITDLYGDDGKPKGTRINVKIKLL